VPRDGREMEEIVHIHGSRIKGVMLSRTTQTNEPARCAVLLPVLAGLGEPLALLEVGASAGLCLMPDRYGYDYGSHRIEPPSAGPAVAPIFTCMATAATPLPPALPTIGWRIGRWRPEAWCRSRGRGVARREAVGRPESNAP
jgi:hypothetical protein